MTDDPERSRRGWWLGGGAVAVVAAVVTTLVVVTGPAPDEAANGCGSEKYAKRDFDADMWPIAVSPNGEYIVGNRADYSAIVLWHDGATTTLTGPSDERSVLQAVAVDDSGAVLGNTGADDEAWLYREGEYRVLSAPKGARTIRANAMNTDGVIVGDMRIDDGEYGTATVPLRWESGETMATRLNAPDTGHHVANAVAEDGTVFGEVTGLAWVWAADDDGGEPLLPKLESDDVHLSSDTQAQINGLAGEWLVLSAGRTVRIDMGDGYRAEPVDKGIVGSAIDASGRVFGYDKKLNAVVFDEKRVVLSGLGDPPKKAEDDLPGDVETRANRVVATSHDGSVVLGETGDDNAPVLWTCG